MKLLVVLLVLLQFSCVEPNEAYTKDAEVDADISLRSISLIDQEDASFAMLDATSTDACVAEWLCWNSESELHGLPCQPECYVPGDKHTFCYLVECEEDFNKK